jgi:hypothetical protein
MPIDNTSTIGRMGIISWLAVATSQSLLAQDVDQWSMLHKHFVDASK